MNHSDEQALLAARMRQLQTMHRRFVHDLRGRLNALVLHLDLLAADVDPTDDRRTRQVDSLRSSLSGLHADLMRTLGLLKTWDTESQRFDAGELIDEVAGLLSGAAKARGVELAVRRPEDGPFVLASRDAIAHVAVVLTWQAIHAAERGTRLELVAGSAGATVNLEWKHEPAVADAGDEPSLEVARQIAEAQGGRLEGRARIELPAAPT